MTRDNASGREEFRAGSPQRGLLREAVRRLRSTLFPRADRGVQPDAQEFRTDAYWERRYAAGGHSGKGSYGLLAQYKADVINAFVRDNNINTVIEHGCGDGNQASLFEIPKYIGYDISKTAVERAKQCNRDRVNFEFFYIDEIDIDNSAYDLALSLDVIFHLVEEELYEDYMARLFKSASRHVIIYCTNYDRESEATHMRHRQFMRWVNEYAADWTLDKVIKNPYSAEDTPAKNRSKADFHFLSRRQSG